jgi:hypothetical protein
LRIGAPSRSMAITGPWQAEAHQGISRECAASRTRARRSQSRLLQSDQASDDECAISDSDFCVLEDEADSGRLAFLASSRAQLTSLLPSSQRASMSTFSRTLNASRATQDPPPLACGRPSMKRTASLRSPTSTHLARPRKEELVSRRSTVSACRACPAVQEEVDGATVRRSSLGAWRDRKMEGTRSAWRSGSSTESSLVSLLRLS